MVINSGDKVKFWTSHDAADAYRTETGGGTFADPDPGWSRVVGVADYNGDAVPDLYVQWPRLNQFKVLNGADGFQTSLLTKETSHAGPSGVGDYNQDGIGDLYEFAGQRVRILDGANAFSTTLLDVALPSGTFNWTLIERDGDGITDLLGTGMDDSSFVLLGASAYTSVTPFPAFRASDASYGHVWADYNGDTISDLIEIHGTSRTDVSVRSGADDLASYLAYSEYVFGNYGSIYASVVVTPEEDYSDDVDHPDINDPELDPGATQHFPDMSFRAPGLTRFGEYEYVGAETGVTEEQRAFNPVVWWIVRILVKEGAGQAAKQLPGIIVKAESLEAAKEKALDLAVAETGKSRSELDTPTGQRLRSFTKRNFRENVRRRVDWSKEYMKPYDTQHTLPVKFQDEFAEAGLNIHNPIFGHPWCMSAHRSWAWRFNKEWQDWFAFQIITDSHEFRREIEDKRLEMVRDSRWSSTYQCR